MPQATKTSDVRVRAQLSSAGGAHMPPFLVGRIIESGACTWSVGDRVLARVMDPRADVAEAPSAACIGVPDAIQDDDALLIPPTAQALRIWRRLRLELGETAVYTDGDCLTKFVALAAAWRGAVPVIRVTAGNSHDDETVSIGDPLAAVERLRSVMAAAPGLAVVDLSGRGETIAMLLESLPRWARLMLARTPQEPFTTAFYTDIHRKGAVVTAADLDSMFSRSAAWRDDIRNACRLLTDAKRATALRACLRDRVATPNMSTGRDRDASYPRS